MIGQRVEPPKAVFEPECRLHQGADPCEGGGPNFFQSQRADDAGIGRQMNVIVPNKGATGCRQIGDDGEGDEQQTDKPTSSVLHCAEGRTLPQRGKFDLRLMFAWAMQGLTKKRRRRENAKLRSERL